MVLLVSELWRLHQEWKEQGLRSPYSPAARPLVTPYISPSQDFLVCPMKTVSLFACFSVVRGLQAALTVESVKGCAPSKQLEPPW